MTSSILIGESFGLTNDLTMVGEGPEARRRARDARAQANPRYAQALLEADAMLSAAWAGDKAALLRVNEAITTSDLFKSATGEVLDTMTLAAYQEQTTQWTKFAARTTVRNFKSKKLRDFTGASQRLPSVPEHSNYPIADADLVERLISVGKFGEQYGYTLEARVNDDIGELNQVPNSWASKARYTEDDEAIELLADPTTGAPNTEFFNAGNGNLGTGVLDFDNLSAAYTQVTTKRDENGRIRTPGPLQLVVGPANALRAEQIMNTTEVQIGTDPRLRQTNPLRGKMTLTVLDNLPGNAWFILPMPTAPRPAFYVAFLTGFETPDLRYKSDQGNRMGGGSIPADQGSFNDDTIWYRVRHIVGAAAGDPLFTYASDGE